mgnify:CR=1 FL=1
MADEKKRMIKIADPEPDPESETLSLPAGFGGPGLALGAWRQFPPGGSARRIQARARRKARVTTHDIIQRIIEREGGYVDHPADKGVQLAGESR